MQQSCIMQCYQQLRKYFSKLDFQEISVWSRVGGTKVSGEQMVPHKFSKAFAWQLPFWLHFQGTWQRSKQGLSTMLEGFIRHWVDGVLYHQHVWALPSVGQILHGIPSVVTTKGFSPNPDSPGIGNCVACWFLSFKYVFLSFIPCSSFLREFSLSIIFWHPLCVQAIIFQADP